MARMIDRLRAGEWISLGVPRARGREDTGAGLQEILRSGIDPREVRALAEQARDRLFRRKNDLQPLIDGAVPVVADEVAAYVFVQEDIVALRHWDWSKDFPVLGPPFPACFIEWLRPHAVLAALGEEFVRCIMRREGVLFVGGTRADAARCPLPALVGGAAEYASWLCLATFGEFEDERIVEMGTTAGVLLDSAGRVLGSPVVRSARPSHMGEGFDSLEESIAAVGLMAICFMHCKSGVRIVETEPPARLNRARVRRGRPPLVRHRTLVIEGLAELLRREGEVGKNGLKRALHLVRGHFAVYTAAKPLLGHFVGTVFRAAHTRGRDRARKVTKDYEVEAPRDGRRGRGIGGGG